MNLTKDIINKSVFNYSIKFNIYFLLLILNFLSYTVYSALSKDLYLVIELIININFVIFFFLYKKNIINDLEIKFNLDLSEVILFLSVFFLSIYLLTNELTLPIMDDEVAYSSRSTRTSMFVSIYLLNKFNVTILNELPLKYIIHLLNFFQLIFTIGLIYIIKKKKSLGILFLILLINLIFRLLLRDASAHPPLNVVFSSIFVSIFGLNHLILRFSYLVPYLFFLIFIYQLLKKPLGKVCSAFFIVSLSTFPFLSLVSVNPDHVLWGCLILIYTLLYICIEKKINYQLILLIISIGILFRISIFTCFILIACCFLIDGLKNNKNIFKETQLFLINQKNIFIILICLPLLIKSIFIGTPSFDGISNPKIITNFINALNSKTYFYGFINNIPPWYYLFIFLCIFTRRRIEIIVFFIFNFFIFFSSVNDLWTLSKYSLEYAVPFIILGQFIFTRYLIGKNKLLISIVITSLLIFMNIKELQNHPKSNSPYEEIEINGLEINKKIEKKKICNKISI